MCAHFSCTTKSLLWLLWWAVEPPWRLLLASIALPLLGATVRLLRFLVATDRRLFFLTIFPRIGPLCWEFADRCWYALSLKLSRSWWLSFVWVSLALRVFVSLLLCLRVYVCLARAASLILFSSTSLLKACRLLYCSLVSGLLRLVSSQNNFLPHVASVFWWSYSLVAFAQRWTLSLDELTPWTLRARRAHITGVIVFVLSCQVAALSVAVCSSRLGLTPYVWGVKRAI